MIIFQNLAIRFARLQTLQLQREEGQTLAEYALILALIAVIVAAALTFLQKDLSSLFSSIGDSL
jgi:pilus assembly protein Flp/PilA